MKLGDPDEAEDVAQETFIRAYRHLHRYDPNRPMRPWLLGICSNLAKNRLRSLSRYWHALHRWAGQTAEGLARGRPVRHRIEPAGDARQAERLWQLVGSLKEHDREVIHLRFFMELSVDETSQVLEVPPGTVKSRQHRALARLRAVLAAQAPDLVPEVVDD